ncbi:MAG: ribonuclease G [Ignavibacteria bacterium RIFCSPLOWO2_02_FULL_55_14]|nr:MAG: ribonuclease G [Ignavibacteria bacterium GWC2_56_12]OGU64124.1 MAG: ribonuclease G [Ignavibacteria bacterium RIFCSPHIGHO2_02_FULL_56_12]OGU70232.1 MAG: ribonuclease G [Ignavibacteria bacterium RIFCSPLOWO2_12_FULL_56_21]OGU74181.1 MAG: ribonuclease G [Ignavibacteria bacterium RIFCSPLOWO2_02_FULL_55_14]HAV23058.1 ribonuclease E/G [Bacteroidota bacterium]
MRKEIIINSTANEHRVAIIEDGRLAELFVESPGKERNVGDVYLGRVAKVMPGIRAAFVDIGMSQDAFLHFSDIGSLEDFNAMFDDDDEDEEEGNGGTAHHVPTNGDGSAEQPKSEVAVATAGEQRDSYRRREERRPEVNLQRGQEILVQITKEPQGKKGVRVRSAISLPGRFLVLIPFDGKVGVSKKLNNFKEKRRLRKTVRGMLPSGYGAIIRTVAEGKSDELLKTDLENLIAQWENIEKSVKNAKAPSLIYKDMDTTSSVIRDLFQEAVERIVLDDKKLFKEIRAYVVSSSPDMADRVELYKDRIPVFDKYGVEKDIQTLFNKKVWLKSGGYLYIEKTEAMTVIDVNSGRYAAKREQELNSLKTDLEAAREVCRQLRLRDIGGLVVIDFIDLDDERNRKKVYDEMKKEMKRDRAKVTVLPMTEFGLVQITRQRIRQTVSMSFSEACPTCGGTGMVQSKNTTINEIERWIRRFSTERKGWRVELRVNPSIAEHLTHGTISRLTKIQIKFLVKVKLIADQNIASDDFKFFSARDNKDITDEHTA